jgi:aspartyl-tRNA synthetase
MTHACFYRTHTCDQLSASHQNQKVILSGWVHRKRDHGHILFIDLRDHYGITQCFASQEERAKIFSILEHLPLESVIRIEGTVVKRSLETINPKLSSGEIEVVIEKVSVLSQSASLPLQVNASSPYPEEIRLKYRFLDLRRPEMHQNIVLRSQVISFLRQRMTESGFLEIHTPILTASSPEGARDYVVPSRLYPGEFYALPQAPQQFKQLLMVAGFDRYFQIAPCFRDEASRADRSPGEFYQLDFEMSFVEQEDVFQAIEPILRDVFQTFSTSGAKVPTPFPRIPYDEALLIYGSDKPDLRNPLMICDITDLSHQAVSGPFAQLLSGNAVMRALKVPQGGLQSRKFFKDLNDWAIEQKWPGLGYVILKEGSWQGPLAKFFEESAQHSITERLGLEENDVAFFMCDTALKAAQNLGKLRIHLGKILDLLEKDVFQFCWIVDFPMYEQDEETGQIIFSHNPFSMPQGGLEALKTQDPLQIKAYQYDIVCNGIELCSGAIRNHLPETMFKAFEIAGYTADDVREKFGALLRAFEYGAPPHGGAAPGIERIIMLLSGQENIREVTPFPLNQQAKDLLMGAPCSLTPERYAELHIRPVSPVKNRGEPLA